VIQQCFAALWHELDDIALICITDRVGKEKEGKAWDCEERLRVRLRALKGGMHWSRDEACGMDGRTGAGTDLITGWRCEQASKGDVSMRRCPLCGSRDSLVVGASVWFLGFEHVGLALPCISSS
jgi:hypothetical protein